MRMFFSYVIDFWLRQNITEQVPWWSNKYKINNISDVTRTGKTIGKFAVSGEYG